MGGDRMITEDEAELYDRQIRLWGVKSQKLIRQANVLCFGLSGLASEIIKTIVLAGINSLTIVEHENVTHADTYSNIFTRNKIGENKAEVAAPQIKTLNPRVIVSTLSWNFENRLRDGDIGEIKELIESADVVFVTNKSKELMCSLNSICRSVDKTIKFYAACIWGFYGMSFTDLGCRFSYITEEVIQSEIMFNEEPQRKRMKKEEDVTINCVEKFIDFVPLSSALAAKSGKPGLGLTKKTNPVLFLAHLLFKFHSINGRFPNVNTKTEDIDQLQKLKQEVIEDLNLVGTCFKKLDDENCLHYIFNEISPVCAVLGAVVGQDILRSISSQDAPIDNFFLFNGVQCNGSVESIKAS